MTATATPNSFSAAGGSGTLAVSTNRDCQWSATAASGWVQLGGSTTGQGDATVSFTVMSNADPSVRNAAIAIGDQQVSITQQGAPCVFTLDPRSDSVSAAGERKTITVTATSAQCSWTARSNVDWLSIEGGAQGTGSGQVKYDAHATTGPTRTGTLNIAGQTVTVVQGEGCTSTLTPTMQNVAASGGPGIITVATEAGCSWSAASNASWIAISSGPSGSGPGTVGYTVNASDGPARSGTLTIDGHTVTISQASGCRYTIDPQSQSIVAAGGAGIVNVHAGPGCTWSAGSNAAWLSVSSGTTGSGDGRVQFTAAASTGPARSGTLTVAGQTFTATQASGCSYALVPTSQDFGNEGGNGSFAVQTSAGCPWTATTSERWFKLTGATSGTGSGTVTFNVDGNPMGIQAKSGPITVNDQTFTVNQAAGLPCVFTLSPTSQQFSAAAGSGSFQVATVTTCPWNVVSNDSWITIVGWPAGVGYGSVNFTVAENPAGSPARTGTIDVRGAIFTVDQAAPEGPAPDAPEPEGPE